MTPESPATPGWTADVVSLTPEAALRRHGAGVERWSRAIAGRLGFDAGHLERVGLAGRTHDLGKLMLPRTLLTKRGPLTPEEWRLMRRHPERSAKMLAGAEFDDIRQWVLLHHERPDGRGYPFGLAGEEIPLEARIIAVADAYDAMTSERPYSRAMHPRQAAAELRACAGSQFDPECVAALVFTLGPPSRGHSVRR